jgi:tetratricopeptide (TPR) repeat protein
MDALDRVQGLKESAKTNRDFGDFFEALADLKEAIDLLANELAEIERSGSPEGELQLLRRQRVAGELADCYGMTGGIFRRLGNLDQALSSYEAGCNYEQNPEFGLVDSYNLTNSLVVQVLADGRSLITLQQEILNAAEVVNKQAEEKRREQWWAWCDVGVLALLTGNHERAWEAYRRFKEKGALAKHFDSTIEVLEGIRDSLEPVKPSISQLISEAIEFLRGERPLR